MDTTVNPIEQQLTDYLAEHHIKVAFNYLGEVLSPWGESEGRTPVDQWLVTITAHHPENDTTQRATTSDFFTGLGHRKMKHKPTKPHAASVLHSLTTDYSMAQGTFNDFCSNCGYDTDSRKALDTYLKCQSEGSKLMQVMGGNAFVHITELLQEY